MNRYFVFKKVSQIQNPEKIAKYFAIRQEDANEAEYDEDEDDEDKARRVSKHKKTPEKPALEKTLIDEQKPFIRRIGIHKFFITGKKVDNGAEVPPKKMTIRIPKK
jgi:hypothetical protein